MAMTRPVERLCRRGGGGRRRRRWGSAAVRGGWETKLLDQGSAVVGTGLGQAVDDAADVVGGQFWLSFAFASIRVICSCRPAMALADGDVVGEHVLHAPEGALVEAFINSSAAIVIQSGSSWAISWP